MRTVTLGPFWMAVGEFAGRWRQWDNERKGRHDRYGLDPAKALETHVSGCRTEIAASFFFGVFPEYLYVDTDDLSSIPYDVAGYGIRGTTHLNGRLILHKDDPDDKPFLLVIDRCPAYDFIGYTTAGEGKQDRFWPGPYSDRPAYFVDRHALTLFDGDDDRHTE